jgi:hypothetical protein
MVGLTDAGSWAYCTCITDYPTTADDVAVLVLELALVLLYIDIV